MKYIVSLGSNIRPSKHVPWVCKKMYDEFDSVVVSRFVRTKAYAMDSKHIFWNGAVMIETDLLFGALKSKLCMWEEASGRNRSHPQSSTRDRTLDLDILWCEEGWIEPVSALRKMPYIWLPVQSLLGSLGSSSSLCRPVWFKCSGKLFGKRQKALKGRVTL